MREIFIILHTARKSAMNVMFSCSCHAIMSSERRQRKCGSNAKGNKIKSAAVQTIQHGEKNCAQARTKTIIYKVRIANADKVLVHTACALHICGGLKEHQT